MSHSERRRDIRIRVVMPAERILKGYVETIDIIEVSYRGLLLKMTTAPALNELMKLRIALPERAIFLFPVPVRVTSHRNAVAVGCKLFALAGADKDVWHDLVSKLLQTSRAA